jgi:hypothetical protein
VPTFATVFDVPSRVDAGGLAFLVAGVTREVAPAVADRLGVQGRAAGVSARAAVANVMLRVHAGLLACKLLGAAFRLANSVGANLSARARFAAFAAVGRITLGINALAAAGRVTSIALLHAPALYAAASPVQRVVAAGVAVAAMTRIGCEIDAALLAPNKWGSASDLALSLLARGETVQRSGTRRVA